MVFFCKFVFVCNFMYIFIFSQKFKDSIYLSKPQLGGIMETIIRHLSNMLDGAGLILEAPHNQRKYKRIANGFGQDQKNLRGDVDTVSQDIRNQVKQAYGR